MSDRLNELRRQRDLVKQHLDWLEAEIADELRAEPPSQSPGVHPRVPTDASAPSPAPSPADTDALFASYRAEAQNAPARVKLGCWLAFVGAFVVLGLTVAAWFILRR